MIILVESSSIKMVIIVILWNNVGIEVGIKKNRRWVVLGKLKVEKVYHKEYSLKKKVTSFGNTATKNGPNNLISGPLLAPSMNMGFQCPSIKLCAKDNCVHTYLWDGDRKMQDNNLLKSGLVALVVNSDSLGTPSGSQETLATWRFLAENVELQDKWTTYFLD